MNRERTCICCRSKSHKQSMVRIVRTPEGSILLDETGKANGRGAYICSFDCLQNALEKGRIAQALKCPVTQQTKQELEDQYRQLYTIDVCGCKEM